jgi:hypothetical protein
MTEHESKATVASQPNEAEPSQLPAYEAPRLTVMDESQVMSVFQVPVVAGSWWG